MTDNGSLLEIPVFDLLTGWEDDFPHRGEISWGRYTNWNEEQVGESLAAADCDAQLINDWEVEVDYYTQLAEEYEGITSIYA